MYILYELVRGKYKQHVQTCVHMFIHTSEDMNISKLLLFVYCTKKNLHTEIVADGTVWWISSGRSMVIHLSQGTCACVRVCLCAREYECVYV